MTAIEEPGYVRVWPSMKLFNILDPDPEEIELGDIAHGLSRQCRYNGHVEGFVSVAEHSCMVAQILSDMGLPAEVQAQGLMHDAAEAYLGDIVSPLKKAPGMEGYGIFEKRMEAAIAVRFKFPVPMHRAVKAADIQAGWDEKHGDRNRQLRARPLGDAPSVQAMESWFMQCAGRLGVV